MANGRTSVQVRAGEVEEQLNHLEHVVEGTVKKVTPLNKGPLGEQTKDFLELMGVVKDAIDLYRDEVADRAEMEKDEATD